MIRNAIKITCLLCLTCLLLVGAGVAQLSPDEAGKLKTTLTPMGAERAGNRDGTIPAWTGGYTNAAGFKSGARRPDPFASDKPLFEITAQNMDKYADKLSDGVKALLKKFPQSYKLVVYQTRRTHANPQWLYDNTYKNALHVKGGDSALGWRPFGAVAGIPFPIPKRGEEVMYNHILRWRGTSYDMHTHHYLVTGGKRVLLGDTLGEEEFRYYFRELTPEKLGDMFSLSHTLNYGPPIRAGEQFLGHMGFTDGTSEAWVYLTGQRRTRKLPNPCCDTPAPQVGGVMGIDDYHVWTGSHLERFNWKLIGKKELYIPYNANGFWTAPKDSDVLMDQHLNPKYVRWELHRVWVVEATLKQGYRHQAARSVYYVDEDSWISVLADRWDSSGHLWKTNYVLPMVAPDLPTTLGFASGFYDMNSGVWAPLFLGNETGAETYRVRPRFSESSYSPASLGNVAR